MWPGMKGRELSMDNLSGKPSAAGGGWTYIDFRPLLPIPGEGGSFEPGRVRFEVLQFGLQFRPHLDGEGAKAEVQETVAVPENHEV